MNSSGAESLVFHTPWCRKREEVDEVFAKETAAAAEGISTTAGERSTGPVDRPQQQQIGRPVRSTDVHKHAQGVAVDRSGRPQKEIGRPPGRPTESD